MTRIPTERVGPVNGRIRSCVTPVVRHNDKLTVAVVIISHNYARFLPRAIRSVRSQTRVPDELIVIDDSSSDNTQEVAGNFDVQSYRIDLGHQYHSMAKGLEVTDSDIICFLDADDHLSPSYIAQGLATFTSYDIGVVYSDMQKFGDSEETMRFPEFSMGLLHRDNFMHAGSLVRREALVSSRALYTGIPGGMDCPTDWYVWRQVCKEGWKAKKQTALYMYRTHEQSQTVLEAHSLPPHFYRAALIEEPVTFFIALSGRMRYWKRMLRFLNKQTWPRDKVKLVLVDSSSSQKFHKRVKRWAYSSDYDDIRVVRYDAGEKAGVADDDRRDDSVRHSVQRAVARIYNKMAREISTEYVLTIEDDVLPPLNVAETLLRSFDPSTVSVCAPLESRYHEGYLHWYPPKEICTKKGEGVEEIGGNGFGCTMLRGSVLKNTVFTSNPNFCNGDFDGSFYARIPEWKKKVNWDCDCIHGEAK